MSLKTIPGFGKSGTSRIDDRSASTCAWVFITVSLLFYRMWKPLDPRSGLASRSTPATSANAGPSRSRDSKSARAALVPSARTSTAPSAQVSREAGDPEGVRLPQDEVAVPDALDATLDDVAVCRHGPTPFPARETITARAPGPPPPPTRSTTPTGS